MGKNTGYAVKKGPNVNAANVSSATALVAATTGTQLGLRTLIVSTSVAAGITIQDDAATPVVLVPRIYMPANATLTLYWDEEDTPLGTAGQDIDIISTTADVVSAKATAYLMG